MSSATGQHGLDISDASRYQASRRVTHYLNGRIDIELRLPLTTVANHAEAQQLARRFADATKLDQDTGHLEVLFY